MQYREIVAVTGLGGLFQLVATKSDGAIVRSLADNSTRFIPSRLHSVTPLESIEIYTTGQNVRLHEVLQKMKESTEARPDARKADDASIRAYFMSTYPDMDKDRVYSSDMKKMLKWYEILGGADLLDFSAYNQKEEESAENTEAVSATEVNEEAAAEAKPNARKKAAAVENADEPAKKTSKKKTEAADSDAEPAKKTSKAKKTEE